MQRTTKLVLCSFNHQTGNHIYSAFEGKQRIVRVQSPEYWAPEWIEIFRKDPLGFVNEPTEPEVA